MSPLSFGCSDFKCRLSVNGFLLPAYIFRGRLLVAGCRFSIILSRCSVVGCVSVAGARFRLTVLCCRLYPLVESHLQVVFCRFLLSVSGGRLLFSVVGFLLLSVLYFRFLLTFADV